MLMIKKDEMRAKAGKCEKPIGSLQHHCKITACKCKSSKQRLVSVVCATCDVGWGNTLFIRGGGASLSWDKGVALAYDEKTKGWLFKMRCTNPIEFKVLINDERWSEGENFILKPGETLKIHPKFL